MNILAHLYLSGDDPEVLAGNFMGDFVKGSDLSKYNPAVVQGILLHRHIDTYTDSHPIFRESKGLLTAAHGHYAGVLVDVFYDHFLTQNWNLFSNHSLNTFADYCYKTLRTFDKIFPDKALRFLDFLQKYDVLVAYKTIDGIDKTLKGLSKRTRFNSKLSTASEDLLRHYNSLEKHFLAFFPLLVKSATF